MGDIQCASIIIIDDSILGGQRNFSIRLDSSGSGSLNGNTQVKINSEMASVAFNIAPDTSDGMLQ